MTSPRPTSVGGPPSRWARTIGTIGIVIGVLIVVDQLDDLWMHLTWTEADWRRVFSAEVARLISDATRPPGFQFAWNLLHMALGALLIVGAAKLRRRSRTGIRLCRAWAWIAIGWAVVELTWALRLLYRYSGDIQGLAGSSWHLWAGIGLLIAIVLMVAFPVFLLLWFSRTEIRADWIAWPD